MTAPSSRALRLGVALCWGLFLFDLALGSVATLWPQLYLDIVHPALDTPQIDLVRRTGALWLAFSAVALRAATAAPALRARWFLVLAVIRLVEVPADAVYAALLSGASAWSQALIAAAPVLNLILGLFLLRLSRKLFSDTRPD